MIYIPIFLSVCFSVIAGAIVLFFYEKDKFETKTNAYKPYDVLFLKDGEAVNLLMWSKTHVIYQRSNKSIEYHKWKVVKSNITHAKRFVANECEANFTSLGIPFPVAIKKENVEEDSLHTKHTGIEPHEEADVNNLEYLDGLDEDQLDQLRIEMEERGLYEDLSKLRDYIILRESKQTE